VRALFISHEADVLPGYLADAAERRGLDIEICDLWDGAALPEPAGDDLLVPLGSAVAAYDDTVPWLAAELDLLRRGAAAGVPIFGVCFGAQALARALGGSVVRAATPEIGWYTIATEDADLIASGPWFEWHFDVLTPPPGARVLARTAAGVQAWQRGRHLGVQFHPEVTPAILEEWLTSSDEQLTARIDADRLRTETLRRVEHAREAAHRLFDRVLAALDVHPPH
jgi:GMP synthase (glutamine-hydrolysing)